MPIPVSCPSCNSQLNLPDSAQGRKVRCPRCQSVFQAPGESPAAISPGPPPVAPPSPIEMREPSPYPQRRFGDYEEEDIRRPQENWGTAAVGLNMIFWSFLVILLFSSLLNAMGLMLQANAGQGPVRLDDAQGAGAGALGLAGGCSILIGALIFFIGMCLCCAAPYPSAKNRALTSVLTFIGSVVTLVIFGAALFGIFMGRAGQMAQNPNANQADVFALLGDLGMGALLGLVVAVILMLISFVAWMLFHVAIADRFQNDSLRRQALTFLGVYLALVVIGQVLNFITKPAGMNLNPGSPQLLQGIYGLVTGLFVGIWFLLIVSRTVRTIRQGETGVSREVD